MGRISFSVCHRYNLRGGKGYRISAANGRYHEYGNRIGNVGDETNLPLDLSEPY